jgi:hypothetical protein
MAFVLSLCACSEREESAFDAQARRADCLAQVAELEAATSAAEARVREALHGVSPEAAEVIRQAHQKFAASNRRAAEILREACRLGAR